MRRSWPRTVGLLAVAALALFGCGDGDDADADADAGDQPPAQTTPPEEAGTEPTPTEAATTPAESAETRYEVQQGDTLWGIAEEHGTTVEAIVEANGIEDPSRIHPGDELVIPPG